MLPRSSEGRSSLSEIDKQASSARDEAMEWRLRLDGAPHDTRVRAEFDAWLAGDEAHQQAWRTIERVWGRLGAVRREVVLAPQPHDRPATAGAAHVPGTTGLRRFAAVAAIALAACLVFYLYPVLKVRLLADHLTSTAELRSVVLDDGSAVQLDAGSAISVRYDAGRREVILLAGAAFFEVVPSRARPFVVVVGETTVTVTGTAFAVRATDWTVAVDVQSGTVDVLPRAGTPATSLSSGQGAVVRRSDGELTRADIARDDVAAWRTRRLIVHDVRFDDVVDQIGRHYPGIIVVRDGSKGWELVSGVFDLGRPAQALNALVQSQNGSLTEITPYVVVISGAR